MGIQNNTVRSVIVTALGLALQQRYLKFMQMLANNDMVDWNEIKEELNGHYGDYLLPTGIMARNIDRIMTECETYANQPGPVIEYAFNFANMEDDSIMELIDAGYIKILE